MKRFWDKVQKGPNCWEWTGAKCAGYGQFYTNGKLYRAHRFIWEQLNGPIPEQHVIMHLCDNPSCVNPDHLKCGTQRENILDAAAKGKMGGKGQPGGESHSQAKLRTKDVLSIRHAYKHGQQQASLARQYKVSRQTVNNIVHRKTWTNI